ncbi:hypothetical protein DPMN_038520 [Dreissena polymorpha]|uniref:Uncharacterized protein n=1 Tax=Dreissena polymorpha TaxID=45954 RepID=A0A9D4MCW1_DREPO|nr:hypothetical protein DPMN_038520 [Dreissena polymorpha]
MAIIAYKEPLLWYCKKIMEFELLRLKNDNRLIRCTDGNGVLNSSDPVLLALLRRLEEIIIEVRQRMNWEESRFYDSMEITNMMLM